MKKFIKCTVFVIIFCFLWIKLFQVLWHEKNPMSYFYDEPKNSLDIAYFGGSNVYTSFNSTLAYNLYGYTTGMIATPGQPSVLTKYLIEEVRKNQNPDLYIIELRHIATDKTLFYEENIRFVTDHMKFSKNRIDTINAGLNYLNVKKDQNVNFYFSFLTYHNSWKSITSLNFLGNLTLYKGYRCGGGTLKTVPQEKHEWVSETSELDPLHKEILLDLINYVKQNKLNVLFIIPNSNFDDVTMRKINEIIEIVQDYNMPILNFNTVPELDIDFSTDMYNAHHLNVYGATKHTLYFAKYLHDHYDLKDHRKDKKYQSWEEEYERLKKDFKTNTNKNFDELLDEFSK